MKEKIDKNMCTVEKGGGEKGLYSFTFYKSGYWERAWTKRD
jgi:hypothetical protein